MHLQSLVLRRPRRRWASRNSAALSENPDTAVLSFSTSSSSSSSTSSHAFLHPFCHLSILIADAPARDGGIKLSTLISASFHHLGCHCLINWLEDETKHGGERKATCLRVKILLSPPWRDSLGCFFCIFVHQGAQIEFGGKVSFLKWHQRKMLIYCHIFSLLLVSVYKDYSGACLPKTSKVCHWLRNSCKMVRWKKKTSFIWTEA